MRGTRSKFELWLCISFRATNSQTHARKQTKCDFRWSFFISNIPLLFQFYLNCTDWVLRSNDVENSIAQTIWGECMFFYGRKREEICIVSNKTFEVAIKNSNTMNQNLHMEIEYGRTLSFMHSQFLSRACVRVCSWLKANGQGLNALFAI